MANPLLATQISAGAPSSWDVDLAFATRLNYGFEIEACLAGSCEVGEVVFPPLVEGDAFIQFSVGLIRTRASSKSVWVAG